MKLYPLGSESSCLRNRITLLFDGLQALLIHRIRKFQDSQQRIHINTKPNGMQKWSKTEKWHFCWLVTSLPLYPKSRGLPKTIMSEEWILKRSVVLLRRQCIKHFKRFHSTYSSDNNNNFVIPVTVSIYFPQSWFLPVRYNCKSIWATPSNCYTFIGKI